MATPDADIPPALQGELSMIIVPSGRSWNVLKHPLGMVIDDPRFRTNTDRVRHIDECDGAVASFIAERTLEEAMAVFSAAEVTATPVYEIDQLVADEHIQARGVIVEVPDAEAGSVLMHNVIPRLSETPGKLRRPAPALGEHTRELLKAVGYSEARIASLIEQAVAKQACMVSLSFTSKLYRAENPGKFIARCSPIRRSRSVVTPVYSTVGRSLVRM